MTNQQGKALKFMWSSVIAVGLGASCGALLRWVLSLGLNATWPTMPLGTLLANLIGAYLVGLAVSFFDTQAQLPSEWKLFIITGFLGGLTTFSTFSAEVVAVLQAGHYMRALMTVGMHLLGSLALTLLGMQTYQWFK